MYIIYIYIYTYICIYIPMLFDVHLLRAWFTGEEKGGGRGAVRGQAVRG